MPSTPAPNERQVLRAYGYTDEQIELMSPVQRATEYQHAVDAGIVADETAHDSLEVPAGAIPADFLLPTEAPCDRQGSRPIDSRDTATTEPIARRWAGSATILLCAAIVFGIGYWGYTGWESTAGSTVGSCNPAGWRTVVHTNGSAAELASARLRSNHAVGPKGQQSCIDIAFVCNSNLPYFELRVTRPGPILASLNHITAGLPGLSRVRLLITESPIESGAAVRIADSRAVERIGHALAGSGMFFTAQLAFANGESADARFTSFNTASALRPVFFACGLREPKQNDDKGDVMQDDR